MQKPGGVIVAAVLVTFLAFIGTLSAVGLAIVSAMMPHAGAAAQPSGAVVEGVLVAIMAIPTVFTWCVAIGLFRGKNWARIGGIVLGCLVTLLSLFFLLSSMVVMLVPQARMQIAHARVGLALAGVFYLLLAAFGVWLAIYLNLQRVRQVFRPGTLYVPSTVAYTSGAALDPAAPPAYVAVPAPAVPQSVSQSGGSSVPRIVVMIIAVFSILGAVSMLGMAAAGLPLVYLGVTLQGHPAALAMVVIAAINIVIGVGLFRRFPAAYYAALALQAIGVLSSLMLLSPSFRARTLETSTALAARMTPQQPPQMQPQMQAMTHSIQNGALLLNAILLPFVCAFFIWALWRDLKTIRNGSKTR